MVSSKEICSDGFRIKENEKGLESFGFISLKTAMKAFFSTYKSIEHQAYYFLNPEETTSDNQNAMDNSYESDYIEPYVETIIHFQHFFELICKDILRKEHELLVLNIDKNHELLYKLLSNDEVTMPDLEKLKTIEFSQAFERLCKLIQLKKLDPKYDFFNIKENVDALKQLNNLRNRIWHRGSYVLRYKALDQFIGKFILPIIKEIVELPEYSDYKNTWKYKPLSSEIDPINEIIKEFQKLEFSLDKIAFLKELGRAAYFNPLSRTFLFNKDISQRAHEIAESTMDEMDNLYNCPVCGVNSLVSYLEYENEIDDEGDRCYYYRFIYNIKCHCCNFELSNTGIGNSEYCDYDLPDYWSTY